MSKPVISFVLPVFRPDLGILERCAKSIGGQSLKDVESIWILDGSCPGAEDIIKKYCRDSRVIEIEHGGACRARNEGLKYAKADIVCFFDSDSALEKEASRAWVDIFDAKPDVGFIYAGYKWFDETKAGYDSEDFDPWLLRVNNYISTCFPVRRKFLTEKPWNESLKSLQDWDFWLSVVERGAIGHKMQGYAFSTALPTATSISGEGCSRENWLERLETVKKLHDIPVRKVCVSSIQARHEGIRLAKAIDADYRDFPLAQPNRYETVIQIGCSLQPQMAGTHFEVFGRGTKNILFWTAEDVAEIFNQLSRKAQLEYSVRLNKVATQYVEDPESRRLMALCGFETKVLPLPLADADAIGTLPEKPRFLVDIAPEYSLVFNAIEKSLPDVALEVASGAQAIEKFSGFVYFRQDAVMTQSLKRMLVTGRHVVSNVKQPFCGFLDDKQAADTFIPHFIDKIRKLATTPANDKARAYHLKAAAPEKLLEVIAK